MCYAVAVGFTRLSAVEYKRLELSMCTYAHLQKKFVNKKRMHRFAALVMECS